jgi:hypothetical protein
MIWSILYERNDTNRTRIETTFICKETQTDLVIGRFERMHLGRLTVIECKPKYKTRVPIKTQWQLNRVDDIKYTPDNSGVYVLINWDLQTDSVRLDVMTSDNDPLISFAGKAENVRKHTMRFLSDNKIPVSLEHASYIGREIERSDNERIDYVQA